MKLWDFNGMDGSFQAFRTIEPHEAHNNRWCRYNRKGGRILVAPGGNQAKIYNREGEEEVEFQKGDMYVVQMKQTRGHCATVNCCEWHPKERNRLITCGNDCTMRLWDAEIANRQQSVLLGPKLAGKKNAYSVCQYSPDGGMIVGALIDGNIQVWDSKGSLNRCETTVMNNAGEECSSVAFDSTGTHFLTRSATQMKLYDTRYFKEPLHIWTNLSEGPNACLFSPDDTLLATPSGGKLKLFSRTTFALYEELELGAPCHQISWNAKINQIACGLGSGTVKLLYSPELSTKGALLCKDRKIRERDVGAEWTPGLGVIHNPDVEEEEAFRKKKAGTTELTHRKKRMLSRPDLPVQGTGAGGQLGTSNQFHVMKKLLKLDNYVAEDPRQALLKYDAEAKANPQYISQAYTETQPEPQFDEEGLKEYLEMEELRKKQQKKTNKF
jgi:WD40 repeat protein